MPQEVGGAVFVAGADTDLSQVDRGRSEAGIESHDRLEGLRGGAARIPVLGDQMVGDLPERHPGLRPLVVELEGSGDRGERVVRLSSQIRPQSAGVELLVAREELRVVQGPVDQGAGVPGTIQPACGLSALQGRENEEGVQVEGRLVRL